MRVYLAAVLAVSACRTSDGETVPPDALIGTPVRISTFNVRRFFDTVCDSGACQTGDYEDLPSAAYFESRATQLADAIRSLDSDVIALQELETQACLDALLSRLGDVMPHGVLGETDFAASVDVAIISKTPIEQALRHRATTPLPLPDGTTTTFSRELLEAHVRIAERPIILFAAHFKAKSDDDPPRRLAEAQASSRIVNEVATREPAAAVLLAGDLNDTPGSPPLDALEGDGGLVRLADDVSAGAQATYTYQGRDQAIDHILLVPGVNATRLPRSARVYRDSASSGLAGSDHGALTSVIVLPW